MSSLLPPPYLLFLGDVPDPLAAKVAQGIRDWRPELCLGQYRLPGCAADMGLPDMTPAEAKAKGARSMVIGAANRGGVLSPAWIGALTEAIAAGMDLASGLHNLLRDQPELVTAAAKADVRLLDVRLPQRPYPIGDGVRRAGKRCLAVGTDCSVGKMYTALAMEKAMRAEGRPATFRATGQTGILITGDGVPLDAIVADFMAGSIEVLTPANDPDHWDLIEGQGSLFHPSFSGVTTALIHGGQPDALILCHEPTRAHMRGLPGRPLPSLEALRDLALSMARIVNPDCQVVGVSINTAALPEDAALALLAETEASLGLPTVDPFRQGAGRLVAALPA
jgi:uncharacterized NAD-dependent epimerase/dehydratase family protein